MRRRRRRPGLRGRRRPRASRPPRAARARSPIPSARDIWPVEGPRSSSPPGRRTSGRLAASSPATSAAASCSSARSVSCQVNGMRLPRANSAIRIVASDERGPTISNPMPSERCSASRRAIKVDRRRSLSDPSSKSSGRSASRSTAMYRNGCVTTAVRKTVCPVRRFISPRKLEAPWRMSSFPAASRIATSPSTIATNGYRRSPTRNNTSPTLAVRSSPSWASVASWDDDSSGLAGAGTG